jgi:CubicO group peptidase (beta-lactamase class C family)
MSLPAPEPLPFDLQPACDVAARFVGDGTLPCIVFGVADGSGRSEVVAVSSEGTRVQDDSVFFIASVTKAIVATALMQYVDEGRLDLRVPLAEYLEELAGGGRDAVSAWHLLTHTSGLPDMPYDRIRAERPDYERLVALALDSSPRWEPGTRYEYNSSAWVLLSELMARLSNIPFPEVLRQRLTGPLGMNETVFDARPLRGRVVPVEGVNAGNRLVAEALLWFLARATFPGGGMFGTVPDLLRLGRSLLPLAEGVDAVRVVSRSAVAEMARHQLEGVPHIQDDGTISYMEQGLGWRRTGGAWPLGDSVITHGGKPGSRLWVDPDRDLAYVFLSNVWDAPSDAAIAVLEEIYRAHGQS